MDFHLKRVYGSECSRERTEKISLVKYAIEFVILYGKQSYMLNEASAFFDNIN